MIHEVKLQVTVDYEDSNAREDFFVAGGFVFKHKGNSVDVSAPEGCKTDQVR